MRAALLAVLSLVATAAPTAAARPQEPDKAAGAKPAPGFVQRIYDLSVFTERVPDTPGPSIEHRPSRAAGGGMAIAFTLTEPLQVGGDAGILIRLIQTNIAEDTWTDKRTAIQIVGDDLFVVQTPAVHVRIAQLLAYLQRESELQITVEGLLAVVENALLDEIRAGALNPAVLTAEAAATLREALAAGDRATTVRILRTTARNGQRVSFTGLARHTFIEDYDLEVTTGAVEADPIVGRLRLGAVLDVRPMFTRGHLVCEIRFSHQIGTLPIPTFETGVAGLGPIGLPETRYACVRTTVKAVDGQTLLAGRIGTADPEAPATSRSLCFFIRPALVPIEGVEAPVSEEKRQMRIFDVGVLTSPLCDFPAPSHGHDMHVRGDEGGKAVIPSQMLLDAIQHNIAAESWENTRNTIDLQGTLLYVRQTPDVLDAIKAYLDDLASRRWRMISSRAEVLAVDKAGHQALLAKYPSLATGVMKLDAGEAADMIARAARGDGLELAASGELAGMNRQQVHVRKTAHLTCVQDYNVELATLVAAYDPQMGVASEGVALECQPVLTGDGKTIHANVRFSYTRLKRPMAIETTETKGIRTHRPSASEAHWRTAVVAEAGGWYLVGGGGPVSVGGGERHLLAIVRFVPAP